MLFELFIWYTSMVNMNYSLAYEITNKSSLKFLYSSLLYYQKGHKCEHIATPPSLKPIFGPEIEQ